MRDRGSEMYVYHLLGQEIRAIKVHSTVLYSDWFSYSVFVHFMSSSFEETSQVCYCNRRYALRHFLQGANSLRS